MSEKLAASALRKARESISVKQRFFEANATRIAGCAEQMAARFERGARLFTMGNGGSACDAEHLALEFTHPVIEKRKALPAFALTTSSAALSAIGNDSDFAFAFAEQLRTLARPGDLALGISTSGKSPNVLRGLAAARELSLFTIGFAGRDGGKLGEHCDVSFTVESFSIHRIQETHETLIHVLWDLVHVALGAEDVMDEHGRRLPVPLGQYEHVVLGHGSGGRLAMALLRDVFLSQLPSPVLHALEDQALLALPQEPGQRLALTTDGFVVRPLFFPGGDIGKLAICGTVNDLAVGGAVPRAISAAFILEEGLPLADLRRIVASMALSCAQVGVELCAGDTKVVERGKGDGVFITTSGVGLVPPGVNLSIGAARPGDRLIVSGPIGDHGIAILSLREGIQFETALESDCAPLADLTRAMLEVCPAIRCMRDPTRGGLAGVLHELGARSGVGVRLVEGDIPLRPEVRAACELFGLDPLHVACEGRLVAVVPAEHAEALLAAMRRHPSARQAALIGEVCADHPGLVTMRSLIGSERLVPLLAGEQLPRIC